MRLRKTQSGAPARRPKRVTSADIAAAGWPSASRSKDIRYHPYFRGAISRWTWRFFTYRLTQPGRWFLVLTLFFTTLGSNSLLLQVYVPFTYIMGVWFVAILCVKLFRPRVRLEAHHPDRIGAGEILPIEIDLQQHRRMAGADMTVVPDRLPPALDLIQEEGVRIPLLRRGQKARLRMGLRCTKRGVHHWEGFRVETEFPLGLVRAYRMYRERHDILVYPQFTRLSRLQIPASLRYQPGGVAMASNLGESFEYIGNREYREGDNIRDIDWRATARLNVPIVREYREEYFLRVGVVLDTYVPESENGKPLKPKVKQALEENFERAVSVSAAVSDYMARSDYLVDIFAAGPTLYHLMAGRSLAYLDQILDILANVEQIPDEPFAALEPDILENLAQITTIVCVLMDWDPARQTFVERLRQEGAGLKVIVVRDTPCTLNPQDADLPGGITVISKTDYLSGVDEI